ncbi:MAG: helix-hairpin-helix domain-containing protein, partial [Chloroflexota bacterium]
MPDPAPPPGGTKPFLFVPTGREGEPVQGLFSVDHITYLNEETGYAVARLVPADAPAGLGLVAVGVFGGLRTGECYRIEGVWKRDPTHGLQVRVTSAQREAPRSLAAIERYLAGASIKGLGPVHARKLVEHFGEGTFDELESGGQRLEEVPGIGPVRAGTIRASWAEHAGIHTLMVNLQGVAGLTPNQAQRIFRQYGQAGWDVVSRNPYRLAEEVRGFGFKTCDRIAKALGLAHDAPERIQAGVVHLLNEALEEGHLWCDQAALAPQSAELLGVPAEAVTPQADALAAQERLVREEFERDGQPVRALLLPRVARAEGYAAIALAALLRAPCASGLGLPRAEAERLIARHVEAELTDEQRGAIASVLMGTRLTLLTGGPG